MFLGHAKDDGSAWSARDRELAKALILHESMQCGGCGQPVDESTDPDKLGWYDVKPLVCVGCHAKEKAASERDVQPGTKFAVSLNPNYVKRT